MDDRCSHHHWEQQLSLDDVLLLSARMDEEVTCWFTMFDSKAFIPLLIKVPEPPVIILFVVAFQLRFPVINAIQTQPIKVTLCTSNCKLHEVLITFVTGPKVSLRVSHKLGSAKFGTKLSYAYFRCEVFKRFDAQDPKRLLIVMCGCFFARTVCVFE